MATDMQSFYLVPATNSMFVHPHSSRTMNSNDEDYYELVRENRSLDYNVCALKQQNYRLIYAIAIIAYILFVVLNSNIIADSLQTYETMSTPYAKSASASASPRSFINKLFSNPFNTKPGVLSFDVSTSSDAKLLMDKFINSIDTKPAAESSIISETDSITSGDSIEFAKSIKPAAATTTADIAVNLTK